MYELVNTSVPNGLVPGTHGFATVAMTKGMPDAIRTRVENFCAYPHRSSAHDASYLKENPVNWFHLALPNNGHVIGCTSPCDFDYTGRTNRLARTIMLKGDEMPAAGGVAALRIAGSRLMEPWSGEPRMLQPDKALAAKFFAADRASDPRPQNWIALFGERGEKLARRTAMLVGRNVAGRGKSLYFKTSTAWDADGTKLLGLFGDLIELLPDEIAPLVTFSTFSPCVPGGTVCHLRGIYDKDNAFELASATQPWVDCENGRVVHEEMLPAESIPERGASGTAAGAAGASSRSPRMPSPGRPGVVSGRYVRRQADGAIANGRLGEMIGPKNGSESFFSFYLALGGIAAAFILAAIVFCVLFMRSEKPSAGNTDEISRMMQADQEEEKERAAQLARDEAEREELERKNRAEEEKRKQDELAAKKKEEADKKAKADRAAAEKAREEAVRKQHEETRQTDGETAKARKENLAIQFDRLKITKVLREEQVLLLREFEIYERRKPDTDRCVLAVHASVITNADSVIVYYADGGEIKSAASRYVPKVFKGVGASPAKTRFKALGWPAKSGDSPWIALTVVNPDWRKDKDGDVCSLDVFWWWNEPKSKPFFKEKEKVDLKKAAFFSDTAYEVYRKSFDRFDYNIAWLEGEEKKEYNTSSNELDISVFKPDSNEHDAERQKIGRELACLKEDIKSIENIMSEAEKLRKNVEGWEDELIRKTKEKEAERNKEKKKNLAQALKERKDTINENAKNKFKEIGLPEHERRVLMGDEKEKERIAGAIERRIEKLRQDHEEVKKKVKDKESKIAEMQKLAEKWKDEVKTREFAVTVAF